MKGNGLTVEAVIRICMDQGWFTNGDILSYNRMLDLVRQDIRRVAIAAAIWTNSDENFDMWEIKKALDAIAEDNEKCHA